MAKEDKKDKKVIDKKEVIADVVDKKESIDKVVDNDNIDVDALQEVLYKKEEDGVDKKKDDQPEEEKVEKKKNTRLCGHIFHNKCQLNNTTSEYPINCHCSQYK